MNLHQPLDTNLLLTVFHRNQILRSVNKDLQEMLLTNTTWKEDVAAAIATVVVMTNAMH